MRHLSNGLAYYWNWLALPQGYCVFWLELCHTVPQTSAWGCGLCFCPGSVRLYIQQVAGVVACALRQGIITLRAGPELLPPTTFEGRVPRFLAGLATALAALVTFSAGAGSR